MEEQPQVRFQDSNRFEHFPAAAADNKMSSGSKFISDIEEILMIDENIKMPHPVTLIRQKQKSLSTNAAWEPELSPMT